MRKLILLALASTVLGACGVKGSLYLPEQRYPQPKAEEPLFQPESSVLDSQPQREAP